MSAAATTANNLLERPAHAEFSLLLQSNRRLLESRIRVCVRTRRVSPTSGFVWLWSALFTQAIRQPTSDMVAVDLAASPQSPR